MAQAAFKTGTMAIPPQMRMELRQAQTLSMTPQLQQAIKLLQLNNLELAELIAVEAEQNPLLDLVDGPDMDFDGSDERMDGNRPDVARDTQDLLNDDGRMHSRDSVLDVEVDNVFNNDAPNSHSLDSPSLGGWDSMGSGYGFDSEFDPFATISDTPTLRDHLTQQIQLDLTQAADRLIAMILLDQLDETGYFTGSLQDIASSLGAEVETVENVLLKMQHFDPAGIFARNLKECLSLQLQEKIAVSPALGTLLDHLDLLASHDMAKLAKLCKVDQPDLAKLIADIKLCNPKPALAFDHAPVNAVTPDIMVRQQKDGSFLVELNPDTLPRALVNQTYYETVKSGARSRQERDYIQDRYHAASWLVKAMHQRATTILKVASEIVKRQEAFFYQGVAGLKPMTLKDVAEAIDMHESTISRVTSNKFMTCARGVFELKYFFSTALSSSHGGDAHSSEAVRQRIKQVIDGESAGKPLSDDQLVIVLQSEGIEVARRTVAKYRESLKIPSSFQRKRRSVSLT